MNENKKKTVAALTAAVLALSSASSVFALYEPSTSTDGYSLGKYTEEISETDRAETEALYASRLVDSRQMEYLTRGLTAVPSSEGVLVSWRYLGTDSKDLKYNLYRGDTLLTPTPISLTNYFDELGVPGTVYTLKEVMDGAETGETSTVTAWSEEYIQFDVVDHGDLYIIDDGAVGDLDGDGEYEYLFRRTPVDMDPTTRTVYPLIEAYDNDGTYMWTINIGPNEINEVDINMAVYDFNSDGKSELILRSFELTTDGVGNQIGDENGDGMTDYSKDTSNLAIFTDRQYIVSTPEFMSMYDGETGAELARTDLLPSKEPLSEWSYRYTDTGRLTKRASHYLWGVAYLDGVTPSIVNLRGAWDNVRAAAWHIENNEFVLDWEANTPNTDSVLSIWGAVNHNMSVADLDFDGKDEICSGPMAIDHDGTTMYATTVTDNDGNTSKLLHGDAFDMAKMDPDYNGYLSWACHENSPLLANIELHDGRTGQVIYGFGKNKDTGRSRAADIDPNYRGFEVWGSTGTIPMSLYGEEIADDWNQFKYRLPDGTYEKDATTGEDAVGSLPMNFKVYWDGDLLSEFLDGTRVSEWDYDNKEVAVLFDADGCASNGGTKAVPCMSADLFGDWREEIVWKTSDEKSIRVYSTNIETPYKIPTLMHDCTYREAIATQSNHYNQPPNVSYYLGAETTSVPVPEIYVVHDGETITSPDLNGHSTVDIVPDGGTVDATKSVAAKSVIKLLLDSPYAYADDDLTKVDTNDDEVTPIEVDGRTLVPVRFISENFGLTVSYDDATEKITIAGRGHNVEMTVNSTTYTVDGVQMSLDVPAQTYNDRTMIPLRAMAEAIGREVFWDDRGLIVISRDTFEDTDSVADIIESLTIGKKIEPTPAPATPEPTATPDPLLALDYTEYTDEDGNTWNLYVDEDFSSYDVGSNGGFVGTKPAPLGTIKVITSGSGKVVQLGGSDKGNRNAIYTLPASLSGKVLIEIDWKAGKPTGGNSSGELRFADAAGNVFLGFSVQDGREMQYSWGGKISNGGLETAEWKTVDSSFNYDTKYHIVIVADFDAQTVSFKVSDSQKTVEVDDMAFETAVNFNAIEVLAVRDEKNFTWSTEVSNIKAGVAAE